MHITLYTSTNCSLCDDAKRMLKLAQEDFPLTWTEVDIASEDFLHEKYMLMVPVLAIDEDVLAYGSITYVDIVELFDS